MQSTPDSHAKIHRIGIFPFSMINAFLLQGPAGCILIDSGLPGTEHKIGRVLQKNGLNFTDIKLIVITHAHIDHAGNAATLRALCGAPILAHRADLNYFEGKSRMQFCNTGWFGWLFSKTGAIQKPYTPFTPDILLGPGEEFNLQPYALQGYVQSTPGHTAGSVSVVLENSIALVGDLISSGILLGGIVLTGKPKRPPFEDDPLQVSLELAALNERGIEMFYMGHGGPLPRQAVARHIKHLQCIACKNTQK